MTKNDSKKIAVQFAEAISEKKGKDIRVIDVEQATPHFDFLVIATADSFLHLDSLANEIYFQMDQLNVRKINSKEPYLQNPWILIDCGFLVVHLFTEEAREFYALEKLWVDGKLIYQSKDDQVAVMV